MELGRIQAKTTEANWREALAMGLDLALPDLFSIEWLIDRAERGAWSGTWS